jgi:acetyl esterase/lipase
MRKDWMCRQKFSKMPKMKKYFFLLLLLASSAVFSQHKVLQLYPGSAPGSESWNWSEAENDSNMFHTKVVYNVTHPSLTVFLPDPGEVNGTAIIICPGGGFQMLSINSEGFDEAKWLSKKGVTCFVLKYRLIRSMTNNPVQEWMAKMGKKGSEDEMKSAIPMAVADGRAAISYVRKHAAEYGVDSKKIGILGFSAGGTVAASSAYAYAPDNRPDFVAPIYPYMPPELQGEILPDAPPMFLAAASDDQLGLATHIVDLYSKWLAAKHPAELHMYSRGGHGFGSRVQHLPSDSWIDRFGDWLAIQGLLKPKE